MTSSTLPISFKRAQRLTGTVPRYGPDILQPATKWIGHDGNVCRFSGSSGSGLTGGANSGGCSRVPLYFPFAVQEIRVVYSVAQTDVNGVGDRLFQGDASRMWITGGVEYPYNQTVTGIPPRLPLLFGGSDAAYYDFAAWGNKSSLIVSDIVRFENPTVPLAPIGIWSNIDLPAGKFTIPFTRANATNHIQRYIGQQWFTTPQSLAAGGSANFAHTASSITAVGNLQTGSTTVFTPVMVLCKVPWGTECVVLIGDSITNGGFGGVAGDGNGLTDAMGDAMLRTGILGRALAKMNPAPAVVNLGVGSEAAYIGGRKNAMRYREEVLKLANPTYVFNGLGHNDLTKTTDGGLFTTVKPWASGATYEAGDSVTSTNWGIYTYTQGGVAGVVAPFGSALPFTDGAATATFLTSDTSGNGLQVWRGLARNIAINRRLKNLVPTATIIGLVPKPAVTTLAGDGGADPVTQQTVMGGFAINSSKRWTWRKEILSPRPFTMVDKYIDVSSAIEYLGAGGSGKYDHNGIAYRYTPDGTHFNGVGEEKVCDAIPASLDAIANAGGCLPFGWAISGFDSVTISSIAVDSFGNRRLTFALTRNNATGSSVTATINSGFELAAQTEQWVASLKGRVVSTTHQINLNLEGATNGQAFTELATTALTTTEGTFTASRTFNNVNTARAKWVLSSVIPAGQTLNATLEISLPTLNRVGLPNFLDQTFSQFRAGVVTL